MLCKTVSSQTWETLLTSAYFLFLSSPLFLCNYFIVIPNSDLSFQNLTAFSSVSMQFSFLTSSKPKTKILFFSHNFFYLLRIFCLSFHFFTFLPFACTPLFLCSIVSNFVPKYVAVFFNAPFLECDFPNAYAKFYSLFLDFSSVVISGPSGLVLLSGPAYFSLLLLPMTLLKFKKKNHLLFLPARTLLSACRLMGKTCPFWLYILL